MKSISVLLKQNYKNQNDALNRMSVENNLIISRPTGVGKSRIFFMDILKNSYNEHDELLNKKVFCILAPRLVLCEQHFKDFIEKYLIEIGIVKDFRFIYVASSHPDLNSVDENDEKTFSELNTILVNEKILSKSYLSHCKNSYEVENIINSNKNRHVVIISTYHSCEKLSKIEIDRIYCDEAHHLVSSSSSSSKTKFYEAFEKINAKNKYFSQL